MAALAEVVAELNAQGYTNFLRMPDGSLCGIMPQFLTTAIVCGLTDWGYSRRYCYEHKSQAVAALLGWDGVGDPPGPWIKEKPSERLGPGATC